MSLCPHEVVPLQACLVGKGWSFSISIDLAVVSQIHRVIFAPPFGTTSLDWEKRWLPL